MKPNCKVLLMASLGLVSSSCQTTSYVEVELSILKNRVFERCDAGEGGLLVTVLDQGKNLLTTELDWLANHRSLTLEAYSSFGQTVGSIQIDLARDRIEARLPIAEAELLAINQQKNILYDDHWIGVQSQELSCFLSGRLPKSWLKKTVAAKQEGRNTTLFIESEGRDIRVDLDRKTSEANSFCAAVSWSRYLGMVGFAYDFCFDGATRLATLTYENKLQVSWKDLSQSITQP